MFRGVDTFVRGHELTGSLAIRFKVDIVPMEFEANLLPLLNQRRMGTFSGSDEGKEHLRKLVAGVNFQEADSVIEFLAKLQEALTHDLRYPEKTGTRVVDQLRQGITVGKLYDYIYSCSYLQPRYILEWMEKDLTILSPGERGTLLLAFYLLIDRDDKPLVIDQPEGNLDNETVYRDLAKCLKDAKRRRQVIIVTHNPNLAVVCDADQVIYASFNRAEGNRITYASGAIENPDINSHIIDVLEGTMPAFDSRDCTYKAVQTAAPDHS
jgi:hypothetical protein